MSNEKIEAFKKTSGDEIFVRDENGVVKSLKEFQAENPDVTVPQAETLEEAEFDRRFPEVETPVETPEKTA